MAKIIMVDYLDPNVAYHNDEMWCYTSRGCCTFAHRYIQRGLRNHFLGEGGWNAIQDVDLSVPFPMIRIQNKIGRLYKVSYDKKTDTFKLDRYKTAELAQLKDLKYETGGSIFEHMKDDCKYCNLQIAYHWYNGEYKVLEI